MKDKYIRDGRAPIPKKEITSKIMSLIRAKHTKPEITLRKALRDINLKDYKLHWNKLPGKPDICYPKKKLAIFINGCFWHRCPKCKPQLPKSHKKFWLDKFKRNVLRDKMKINGLKNMGWKVVIVWECEITKKLDTIINNIRKYYG